MGKLSEEERKFLTDVRDGTLFGWVDRTADKARQSTRRKGLSVCDKRTGKRAWHLTDAGSAALLRDEGTG